MPHIDEEARDRDNFDKVNFVIHSWTQGCDAPWYVYIETMKPAALEAFIVIISFGWADVLRGALRPKGLGRRTGKRKGKWAKRRPRFPELGNTLGKSLPFAEQVDDWIKWGTKTKFLWRIDNVAQIGLFFWLVADVAEDFAFNWTSLLYDSYWCQPDEGGKFSYHRTGNQSQPDGVWRKINYPDKDYEFSPPNWSFASGRAGPNGASVVATATFTPFGAAPPPTAMKVRIKSDAVPTIFAETEEIGPNSTNNTTLVLNAFVPPNESFRVETFHEPATANVGDGVVIGFDGVKT